MAAASPLVIAAAAAVAARRPNICSCLAPQDLQAKAVAAGFKVQECTYVCVFNTNRRSGVQLRRVFVHGLFRRCG